MKKGIVICIIFLCLIHMSLFAGGKRENPVKNNVYAYLGPSVYDETEEINFAFGIGYEGAIGNYFSLGAFAGIEDGDFFGFNLLVKPRFYINSALEKFFVGGNIGLSVTENYYSGSYYYGDYYYDDYYSDGGSDLNIDFTIGLNLGYKFVFGSKANGFSLEPSIGYDFLPGRFNIGIALGFAWGGGAAPKAAPAPAPAPKGVPDGIYVGIITFGPNAEDITGGYPILLDNSGRERLIDLINTKYQRENVVGTALFYAAHMGLANMKNAERRLPRTLRNATMVTFTDGLDVSSSGLSLAEISDPGGRSSTNFSASVAGRNAIEMYRNFIQGEIRARTINGTKVEAYIAAIPGDDVTDIVSFDAARSSLASEGGQYGGGNRNVTFATLPAMFTTIAGNIVDDWTQTSFTMITPQYPPGTRVRMTFNAEASAQQAQNARLFFEGTVEVEGRDYYLTDIRYGGGLQSSIQTGGKVKGVYNTAGEVSYVFPMFAGFTFPSQAEQLRVLKQWQMSDGSNVWQINSEYRPVDASRRIVQRHSAVIYLILDKSNSIAPSNIPLVRQAAVNFIQHLYNTYYQR